MARHFSDVLADIIKNVPGMADKIAMGIADVIDNLSNKEVPHDEGILQASWTIEDMGTGWRRVGYHTVYAARLHEHPDYRFQKGRKGKYLEDPIKRNSNKWPMIAQKIVQTELSRTK